MIYFQAKPPRLTMSLACSAIYQYLTAHKKLDLYNRVRKPNPVVRKALPSILSDNVDEADGLKMIIEIQRSQYIWSHVDCDILKVGSEAILC